MAVGQYHDGHSNQAANKRSFQFQVLRYSLAAGLVLVMWITGMGFWLAHSNADDPHCAANEAWVTQTDTCVPVVAVGGE